MHHFIQGKTNFPKHTSFHSFLLCVFFFENRQSRHGWVLVPSVRRFYAEVPMSSFRPENMTVLLDSRTLLHTAIAVMAHTRLLWAGTSWDAVSHHQVQNFRLCTCCLSMSDKADAYYYCYSFAAEEAIFEVSPECCRKIDDSNPAAGLECAENSRGIF